MASKKKRIAKTMVKFYYSGDSRWYTYDIPDTKIEVMQIENVYAASATVDDPYGYFYNHALMEISPHRIGALTSLFSLIGLPAIIDITTDKQLCIYDIYPKVELYWQQINGEFQDEKLLPKRKNLEINFYQRADGSWKYRHLNICEIEVMEIDGKWLASATVLSNVSHASKNFTIHTEHDTHDVAVHLLLQRPEIVSVFGLPFNDLSVSLYSFYDTINITWNAKQARLTSPLVIAPFTREKKNCSWRTVTTLCDDSGNCGFCSSSGSAYIMRWDD